MAEWDLAFKDVQATSWSPNPSKSRGFQAQEKKGITRRENIPKTHLAKATENPITLANQKQTIAIVYLL